MIHKKILIIIIFTLILANTSFSQEDFLIQINPYNTQLSNGETFQAEIYFNNPISNPKQQNIKLYKETNQPISPFFKEIENNNYFLYFQTPLEEGTYTLKIENIPFLVNNVLKQITKEQEIEIITQQPSLSITPGYKIIKGKKTEQITLNIKSNDIDTNIEISTPNFITHPYNTPQTINKNKLRKFTLTADTSNLQENTKEFINITYSSKIFTIPIHVLEIAQKPQEKQAIEFLLTEDGLFKTLGKLDTIEGTLKLKNKLNQTLENLKIIIEGDAKDIIQLNQTDFLNIPPLSELSIFLWINKEKLPSKESYQGTMIAQTSNHTTNIPIIINIEQQKEPEETKEEIIIQEQKEENKSEEIIDDFLIWNIEEEQPVPKKTPKSIFFIMILLLIAIIIFFISKKSKIKKKTFSEIIKKAERR